jgi:hypothetical protein
VQHDEGRLMNDPTNTAASLMSVFNASMLMLLRMPIPNQRDHTDGRRRKRRRIQQMDRVTDRRAMKDEPLSIDLEY